MNDEVRKQVSRCIRDGTPKPLKPLLKAHPEIVEVNDSFGTWLHMAARKGYLEIAKLLVENGCDVNAKGGAENTFALSRACIGGNTAVVSYLLEQGSEMDLSSPDTNPLFIAIKGGHAHTAKALIGWGIDITTTYEREDGSFDALELAREKQVSEIVDLLTELLESDNPAKRKQLRPEPSGSSGSTVHLEESDSLDAHGEFLQQIAKPSVALDVMEDSPTPESSRFGGDPFVPPDFEWPQHEVGEYRFLGQINFAELAEPPAELPKSGLLVFFYAHDEECQCDWSENGYVVAHYWEDFANHYRLTSTDSGRPESKRIKLTTGSDLPREGTLRSDWPFDFAALEDEYLDHVDSLDLSEEYLLGYPSFTSLAYDPTPGPEWTALLTLGSLEAFDWFWQDGDKLMVFIESAQLARRDFGNLKCVAG